MAFRNKPVVVEIDGRIHLTPGVFESDRLRGNDLVLAGKPTLHFTYRMLKDDERMVIDTTIRALALR
jgi:very-short-patch-repair endonuclease